MKNIKRLLLPSLFLLIVATPQDLLAQKNKAEKSSLVDSRDQALGWYLPVTGAVTVNGTKTEGVSIKVYQDNTEMGTFAANKTGTFTLELDLDNYYSLLITKEGFQPKLISVDTHLAENLVKYPAYECFVNLEPEGAIAAADPFYLDFPTAIVRYDAEVGGYYHSQAYLEHINNKLHAVAQASF